jgi:outer membrane biosynthesis protein TonB
VKYKVLIKKCTDPGRADTIADEIARWSGTTADVVRSVITQKPVCIRKEADENEALRLKQQFEAIGAEIELVALEKAPIRAADDDEEDEDAEDNIRTLSDSEYSQVLSKRNDIFHVEKDSKLRNLVIAALIIGLGVGFWMSTIKIVQVATDFFEKIPEERVAKFVKGEVDATLEDQKKKKEDEEKKKEDELKTDKKTLKKASEKKGAGGTTGGGGDPRARVTQKGVLGIISGKITGKAVASADIFGKGGFASGIDGILQGIGGLKTGGSGGVGRRGAAGIGFGAGYGSGFGGGSNGVDDLIGGLLGGEGESSLSLKKRGTLSVSEPKFVKGGALTGGRSRASIMRVVMQNIAALRYAYNKRLREKPGLKGKITCKFAIDEFGKVIYCEALESTMSDPQLEAEVVDKIKRWVFEKIDKPGDVTEVVYPFVFSQ